MSTSQLYEIISELEAENRELEERIKELEEEKANIRELFEMFGLTKKEQASPK